MIGIFWPISVLEREKVELDKADLEKYDGEEGLYRDPKHGQPPGTIEVFEFKKSYVERGRQMGHSDSQSSKQLKETWTRAKEGLGTVTLAADEKDDGSSQLRVRHLTRHASDDSWGDRLLVGIQERMDEEEPQLAGGSAAGVDRQDDDSHAGKKRRLQSKTSLTPKASKDDAKDASAKAKGKTNPKPPASAAKATAGKRAASASQRPQPKAKASKDAKVYPSVQLRAISALEHCVMDAQALLTPLNTLDGAASAPAIKMKALSAKIETKLCGENAISTLTAPNSMLITQNGRSDVEEDLGKRGKACADAAKRAMDQLSCAAELCASYQQKDSNVMEGCANFLLHAYEDAKSLGFAVPHDLVGEIIQRRAMETYREAGKQNRTQAAISIIDSAVDGNCGMKLARGDEVLTKQIHIRVAAALFREIVQESDAVPQMLSVASTLLCNVVKESNILELLRAFITVIECNATTEEVRSAIATLSARDRGGLEMGPLYDFMAEGEGKRIIKEAKLMLCQRVVDEGRPASCDKKRTTRLGGMGCGGMRGGG